MDVVLGIIIILTLGVLLNHYLGVPFEYYTIICGIVYFFGYLLLKLKVGDESTSISERALGSYKSGSQFSPVYYDQNK